MWAIAIHRDIQEYRDSQLTELLNSTGLRPSPTYVAKDGPKYSKTWNISHAKVYTNKTMALKLINIINAQENDSTSKINYKSTYYYIAGHHLSLVEIDRNQWDKIIDSKIETEKNRSWQRISKLEMERRKWK